MEEDRYIPKLNFFKLTNADINDGYRLSVDWKDLTTPEETIIRVGCTYLHKKSKYKDFENRVIYSMDVDFLESMEEIDSVTYNPSIKEPEEKGYPNNIAHSSIKFDNELYDDAQARPAILTELRNHVKHNKVYFDLEIVRVEVEKYRNLNQF